MHLAGLPSEVLKVESVRGCQDLCCLLLLLDGRNKARMRSSSPSSPAAGVTTSAFMEDVQAEQKPEVEATVAEAKAACLEM